MGEVIYGIDFKGKKRLTPERAIVDLCEAILRELSVSEVIYESSVGFIPPEKDPA